MERRGVYGIQASFTGDGILEPSRSGYTLSVFEPVFLELSGDREVQVGEEYVINGTLMDSNGDPLALKQIEDHLAWRGQDIGPDRRTGRIPNECRSGAAGEIRH